MLVLQCTHLFLACAWFLFCALFNFCLVGKEINFIQNVIDLSFLALTSTEGNPDRKLELF